jgi:hypothetical protein
MIMLYLTVIVNGFLNKKSSMNFFSILRYLKPSPVKTTNYDPTWQHLDSSFGEHRIIEGKRARGK